MYFLLQIPWERAGGNLPRASLSAEPQCCHARALLSFPDDLPHTKGIPQVSAESFLNHFKHWECSMKDWGTVYTPIPALPTQKSPIPAGKCGGTSLLWISASSTSRILELRLEKSSRIIRSNHSSSIAKATTNPCPPLPQPQVFGTFQGCFLHHCLGQPIPMFGNPFHEEIQLLINYSRAAGWLRAGQGLISTTISKAGVSQSGLVQPPPSSLTASQEGAAGQEHPAQDHPDNLQPWFVCSYLIPGRFWLEKGGCSLSPSLIMCCTI